MHSPSPYANHYGAGVRSNAVRGRTRPWLAGSTIRHQQPSDPHPRNVRASPGHHPGARTTQNRGCGRPIRCSVKLRRQLCRFGLIATRKATQTHYREVVGPRLCRDRVGSAPRSTIVDGTLRRPGVWPPLPLSGDLEDRAMDADRFDTLARSLTTNHSRRSLARLLGGISLGGLVSVSPVRQTFAARLIGGASCKRGRQCKTGKCVGPIGNKTCSCSQKFSTCKPPSDACKKATCSSGRCVTSNSDNDISCGTSTCQESTCACQNGTCVARPPPPPPPECLVRDDCPVMRSGFKELCCRTTQGRLECCNILSDECDATYRVSGVAAGEACCAKTCCTGRCFFREGFPNSTLTWRCESRSSSGLICA